MNSERPEMDRPHFKNHGVSAEILISLVQNTAPFLFEPALQTNSTLRYVEILRSAAAQVSAGNHSIDSDLWGYFELAISSHFATVGTFVPTDVDLAIRQKLWTVVMQLPNQNEVFAGLWKLVQEFKSWDESLVSKRVVWVELDGSLKKMSGHQGEWFTIAMGAYATALQIAPEFVPEIRNQIEALVKEQEACLIKLREIFIENPTIEFARAYLDGVAAVAHNLGDLDRMFELWEIGELDALKRRVFRSGHEDSRHPRAVFIEAGKIYQELLASENHRHFALREPKGIRKSSHFLLSYGPFLDDWGMRLITEGYAPEILSEGDLREVVEALVNGWKRLNARSIYLSQGYSRALCGIATALGSNGKKDLDSTTGTQRYARGRIELENLLPPLVRKELTQGGLRTLMNTTRTQFENQWVRKLESLLERH